MVYDAISHRSQPTISYLFLVRRLTDDHGLVIGEAVRRNLEVERSRALPDTTGDIVVRTVARAEPATKVTSLTNGDTTKVCADT